MKHLLDFAVEYLNMPSAKGARAKGASAKEATAQGATVKGVDVYEGNGMKATTNKATSCSICMLKPN